MQGFYAVVLPIHEEGAGVFDFVKVRKLRPACSVLARVHQLHVGNILAEAASGSFKPKPYTTNMQCNPKAVFDKYDHNLKSSNKERIVIEKKPVIT